jgi:outer membrane murein-binding lipoprotein Lpp
MEMRISKLVRNIRDKIKKEGHASTIVGLAVKIDNIAETVKEIQGRQIQLEQILVQNQQDVYQLASELIDKRIRSTEGMNLVKMTTQDVYLLNKHIERLERKIEEMRPKSKPTDNPYPHLFNQ